ncbi:MAG: protein kinase [Saprospiraceae bacterium]|nr:protein kinase [Saprospiraceae bacterium]MBK7738442.1 protein kinase [Saprospiraceae bacterium]MBK7912987.1 protein kinase [Saprospiraceae bacterium]
MSKPISEREKLLDLKPNQEFKNYKIVSKKPADGEELAIPIGEGGSGIVYLAEQTFVKQVKVNRAIKFFVYRDDIASQTIHEFSGRISAKNFNDEILNISSFNHENIIKIIDGGIIEKGEHHVPFIVTDYVEGHTLRDLLLKPELIDEYAADGQDIIDLFGQICSGLEYLHRRHFYHCDIAPKNIFIKGEKGNFQVVIGDLGIGKTLRKDLAPVDNKLFVHGTRDYMPQKVYDVRNKEIEYKEFLKLQPEWDLYATKKTFQELLTAFEKRNNMNKPWFKSLKKIVSKEFRNISDVAKNIERQKPIYRQTAGTPELSEADSTTNGYKELQPIKSIWVTDRVKKVIRHPLFFRMKKVPQLLSANTFNPGSNHTRYEHSLGTYENMRQVLISLLRNEDFIEILDEKNIELALLASLLSSISKFPFSFLIHEIRDRDRNYFSKITGKVMLTKILNFKDEEKGIKESLWEVIDKNFQVESLDKLIEIISGDSSSNWMIQNKIISALLNSSIDVRVLDFLPRDSYHLGISTGAHINFDSLIEHICIHDNTIAINVKGVTYVEQVITLRYWLYKRIYWNNPNRAYSTVLKYVFTKLHLEKSTFEDNLLNKILFSDPIDMLYFLDEESNEEKNGNTHLAINKLLKTIFSDRPTLFKDIFVINQTESTAQLKKICKKFSKMPFAELEAIRKELETELSQIFKFNPDTINIIIDIPNEENKKLGEDLSVIKYDKTVTELSNLSGIIDGIIKTFDNNLQFLRVYLNPIYKDQLPKEPDKRKEMHDLIQNFLVLHG